MSEIRDDELLRRLAETIAWCTALADPAHEFRSPALQPPHPRDAPLGGYDLSFAARCAILRRPGPATPVSWSRGVSKSGMPSCSRGSAH